MSSAAGNTMGYGNMMGWGGGWGTGNMIGFAILCMVIVIVVVVLVARSLRGPATRTGEDRALAVLRERYARGEIDKSEFDARKKDLG